MRRKDKEITDIKIIEEIIKNAKVCRIGMCSAGTPYVVPVCFGYSEGVIYFHSARKGKKIDFLKDNNRVCFEFDSDVDVLVSDDPCKWSMRYKSVIGYGRAYFVEDDKEKKKGMEIIMGNYSDCALSYNFKMLDQVVVIKILIDSITGKWSGY